MEERRNEEMQEYTVFSVTTNTGAEAELAVIDEFELDGIVYVVSALVEGDTISADGVYLYRSSEENGEFKPLRIESMEEYEKVSEYYLSREAGE